MQQPPNFGLHITLESFIENGKIFEPHPTIKLWFTHIFPVYPMNLSIITPLFPPNFSNKTFNLITQTHWELKATYIIWGDGLCYSFYQNTYDSNLVSHPCNFRHILSLIQLKLAFFRLPTREGSPKYFSNCWISTTPKVSLITCRKVDEVDLLKKTFVFSLLIFWPKIFL